MRTGRDRQHYRSITIQMAADVRCVGYVLYRALVNRVPDIVVDMHFNVVPRYLDKYKICHVYANITKKKKK